MSGDLIRQLKALKHEAVRPNTGWIENNRALLLSQIKNTIPSQVSVPISQRVAAAFSIFIPESIVSGAVRFAAIFLIISLVAPSLYYGTVMASEGALPGDGLYSAKRYAEKIQVTLIGLLGDNKSETKFHVELAKRRADETRRIVNDPNKVSNVASTVADLRSEIAAIGDKLNQNDGALGADVAKDIKHDTDQIKNVLQDAKNDLLSVSNGNGDSLAQDVRATRDLVQDISTKAVEVMVTKHLEGDTSVSKDDVKAAINSMVKNNIEDLTQSNQNIAGMQTALQTAKSESSSTTKDFNDKVITAFDKTLQAAQVSNTISAEANRKAAEVTQLLGNNQLSTAVDRMKDLTQVTRDVENISDKTVTQSQPLLPVALMAAVSSSINIMSSTPIIVSTTEIKKPN